MTNLLLLGFLPSGSEWIIIALVIVEYEIIVARCQYHMIEKIGHSYKIAYRQHEPNPNHPKEYLTCCR